MKLNSNYTGTFSDKTGKHFFYLEVQTSMMDELNKLSAKKCVKSIEIKQYREKRSLTSNAYCHVLIDAIAKMLISTHDEIYEQMLRDYGVHVYSIVLPKDIADKKKDYKFVEPMNKVKVKSDKGIIDAVQIDCIRGSSKYDSLQMSKFIEGIKTECDTLGIETLSPDEIKRMIDSMEVKIWN